jgi:putative DNA primase/helicase
MNDRTPFEHVLATFESAGSRVSPRGGRTAEVQCLAHPDRDPSMTVSLADCGQCVVLHCHANCTSDAVLDAAGLGYADLYHPECLVHRQERRRQGERPRPQRVPRPRTAPTQAAPKPPSDVPSWWPNLGRPDTTFRYCDTDGTIVGEVRKYEYHHEGVRIAKTFRAFTTTTNGTKAGKWATPVLYRLPQVRAEAAAAGTIYICEGEADADAVAAAGSTATTAPFGAGSAWLPEYTAQLQGAANIVIIRDRDEAGHRRAAAVFAELQAAGHRPWIAEAAAGNDARDHFAAGHALQDLVPVDAAGPAFSPTSGAAAAEGASSTTGTTHIDNGWDSPRPLDAKRLPAFPVERLGALRPMVDAIAEAYQVPPDLPAFAGLAAIGTAVGGRRVFTPEDHWREAPCLYVLAAMESGEMKSPVVDAMKAPLYLAQQSLNEGHELAVSEHELQARLLAEELANNERIAAKDKDVKARQIAAADAKTLLGKIAELGAPPKAARLTAGDVTPESLGKLLADQNGRIGMLLSEAGFLGTLAGRYNRGQANLDLVLEAYRGGRIETDRVTRDTTIIDAAYLNLALCIQPGLLAGMSGQRDNQFKASGLLARFLYSIPNSLVGMRRIGIGPPPYEVTAVYADALVKLVTTIWATAETIPMRLEGGAYILIQRYRAELEPRLGRTNELGALTDWASKLTGQLVRIAGLLTLLAEPCATTIGEQRMADAIAMSDYFISHAWRAYDLMGDDVYGRLEPARAVLAWLRKRAEGLEGEGRHPLTPFTARDVQRGLNGRQWVEAGGAEAVIDALANLKDYGWITEAAEAERKGPGRPPAQAFLIHPWVAEPEERARR